MKMLKVFQCVMLLCMFSFSANAAELTLYATSLGQADLLASAKTKNVTVPELTVEAVVKELSAWTGLDFSINDFTLSDKKLTIDWSPKSSLFVDTVPEKTSVPFEDMNTLRWFMLDSLYVSLMENFDVEAVSYTEDGGKMLVITGLKPVSEFALGHLYKGSTAYFPATKKAEKAEVVASTKHDTATLFKSIEGAWRVQEKDTPHALIFMDGKGAFSIFSQVGTLIMKGYLEHGFEDDQNVVEMYSLDKKFVDSFFFESENEFTLGDTNQYTYIKQEKR